VQKLDRLGWAAGISIRAFGVRIGVRVNDADALRGLEAYFPPSWQPASSSVVDLLYSLVVGGAGARPGVRRFHLLYANASRLGRSLNLDDVYEGFEHYLHLHVPNSLGADCLSMLALWPGRGGPLCCRGIVVPAKAASSLRSSAPGRHTIPMNTPCSTRKGVCILTRAHYRCVTAMGRSGLDIRRRSLDGALGPAPCPWGWWR
jgi:hypothetical protein